MADKKNDKPISIVTELKSKQKGKSKEKEDKPKPPPKGVIEDFLVEYFNRKNDLQINLPLFMPEKLKHQPFNIRFYKEPEATGVTRIVEVGGSDGIWTAREISKEELASKIDDCLSIFSEEEKLFNMYRLNFREVETFARKLTGRGRQLKKWPDAIGFKTQKGFFLERLDFDPKRGSSHEEFPFFCTILKRMNNPEAFCQRIGSIHDPKANLRQTPFIYGPGGGGKTILTELLKKLAGSRGYAAIDQRTADANDMFNLEHLVDKRVLIGDEIGQGFIRSDVFKALTGGSTQTVRQKGIRTISVRMHALVWLFSNHAPEPTGDEASISRMLPIHLEKIEASEKISEEEVWERFNEELPAFLGYCMDAWEALGGKPIPLEDDSALQEAVDNYESPLEIIFNEFYKLDSEGEVEPKAFTAIWKLIQDKFPHLTHKPSGGHITRNKFEEYLLKITGREGKHLRAGRKAEGSRKNVYYIPGIKVKLQKYNSF